MSRELQAAPCVPASVLYQHSDPLLPTTNPPAKQLRVQRQRVHPIPILHRRGGDVSRCKRVLIQRVDGVWRVLTLLRRRHTNADSDAAVGQRQLWAVRPNAAVQHTGVCVGVATQAHLSY